MPDDDMKTSKHVAVYRLYIVVLYIVVILIVHLLVTVHNKRDYMCPPIWSIMRSIPDGFVFPDLPNGTDLRYFL